MKYYCSDCETSATKLDVFEGVEGYMFHCPECGILLMECDYATWGNLSAEANKAIAADRACLGAGEGLCSLTQSELDYVLELIEEDLDYFADRFCSIQTIKDKFLEEGASR